MFTTFILSVILTEALTELAVKSEIFFPIRKWFFELGKANKLFNFIHSLLDCGYCFSVWAGWLVAFIFFRETKIINYVPDWIVVGIIIHRLSNLLHNLIDRTR